MAAVSWSIHRGREEAPPGRDDTGSEDALVAAAQADPQAFSALYQRYVGPVYRFCYVRLSSAQEAEDATSKVFARALAGLADYRGGAFVVWLFRIAQNTVIDTLRGRRPMQGLDAVAERSDPAPGPEDATLAHAEGEALRQALGQLTAEQRLVIELQLAGWSGPEIAPVDQALFSFTPPAGASVLDGRQQSLPIPPPSDPAPTPLMPTPIPAPTFKVLRPTWLPEPMTVREQVEGDIVTLGFDPQPDGGTHAVLTLHEVPLGLISEGGNADPQAMQEQIGDYTVTVIRRGQACVTYTWDAGDLRLTLSNVYDPPGQLKYSCEQMRKIVESVR